MLKFLLNTAYLGLQRGDPRVQLLDRQGVEVLLGQLRDQIAGAPGKIVGVHDLNR